MAKDTEKLIRQLSLISFLMAERRPVSALEIKRDVEGYSGMNDDAFARRFYADRSELESLGIRLKVERPSDGHLEAEVYSLPPENFYLPAIEFSDSELAGLHASLSLLDGSFAYAEPLRLALQQLTWGRPSPVGSPTQRAVGVAITASAGGRELSHYLSKVETAIERRKTIRFTYHTMTRDVVEQRRVDPYQLVFRGGQFYLVGFSHERGAMRVFRLSRIRGKIAYATKAEHDFSLPDDFDPREYAARSEWQLGETIGTARIWVSDRVAWLVERDYGMFGRFVPSSVERGEPRGGVVFETSFGSSRRLVAWALGLQDNVRILSPDPLVDEAATRLQTIADRHSDTFEPAEECERTPAASGTAPEDELEEEIQESVIRPERFARLVTLAGILIRAARREESLGVDELRQALQLTREELEEDIGLLNVVNFGAGSYVLYAEIRDDRIEVDPEPYGDSFARPARLLPLEAKALVAAIDLLGDHLPEGSLSSARHKIIAALGTDPARESLMMAHSVTEDSEVADIANRAIASRCLMEIEYYKPHEDAFTCRTVEPYALINGREGWYVVSFDLHRKGVRHFRLDRIKRATISEERFEPRADIDPIADLEGWPRTGELPESKTARVWISPERARWVREEREPAAELADGAIIVEISFAGTDWLVREVLKEAGDAAVLAPIGAREAVRGAAARLKTPPAEGASSPSGSSSARIAAAR